MKRTLIVLVLSGYFSPCIFAEDSRFRQEISLNGQWDFWGQPGKALNVDTVKNASWTKAAVPHTMFGTPMAAAGTDCGWYRMKCAVPEAAKGRRVEICFYGIGPYAVLYINGKKLGDNIFMVTPWVTDITDHVMFGRENEILVGIEGTALRGITDSKGRFTIPNAFMIGEANSADCKGGIWYEVWLRIHPDTFTQDVHVQPSFRQKKIKASLNIMNGLEKTINLKVSNHIVDKEGKTVLSFPDTAVMPAGREAKTITIEKEWSDPHLWFPHDPYLYHWVTTLTTEGREIDQVRTRFGFREAWVEKTKILFNGINAPIRRTTEGPCFVPTKREWYRGYMEERKSWGVNNIRWHCCPVPDYILDISDEVGMLITQEGDMWLPYHYALSERYWKLFEESWSRIAKFSRNHPSIFMYSMANESIDLSSWNHPNTPLATGFKEVAKHIKKADPRTFINEASGDDVWGLSPVRDWHYPNNLSARWCVPNDFYWLRDNPHPGSPERPGHRTKPVLVGEDYFDGFRMTMGSFAAYAGEDYYLAGPGYRDGSVYAAICRLKTDAYRMSPIAIINPADPCIRPSLRFVCPPVAMLDKDFRQNLFADKQVGIDFGLANEVWYPQKLKVQWRLVSAKEKKVLAEGTLEEDMPAGTIKTVAVSFKTPEVKEMTVCALKIATLAGGKVADENQRDVYIFPDAPLKAPPGMTVAVFDPGRKTALVLKNLGLQFEPVTNLLPGTLERFNTVIIGSNLGTSFKIKPAVMASFLARGGNIFVFEQIHPLSILPGQEVAMDGGACTMSFPRRCDHPVLKGLSAGNLRWWGKDHWVTRQLLSKPFVPNYRVLVEAADPMGLRLSPLLEYAGSSGRVILCQLLVGQKLLEEPAARALFQNALNYFAMPKPASVKVKLQVPAGSALSQALARMKLDAQSSAGNLSGCQVLISEGKSLSATPAIRNFVTQGGTWLIKSLSPGQEKILNELTGLKIKILPIKPYQGIRVGEDPLVSGISQFDVWWRVGDWVAGQDGSKPVLPFCDYVLEGVAPEHVLVAALAKWDTPSVEVIAALKKTAAVLVKIPVGKGRIVIDQANWDNPLAAQVGFQYAVSLLANLGIRFLDIVPEANANVSRSFVPISLKKVINHNLRTDLSGTPEGKLPEGVNNLAQLPLGSNVPISGIPFDISGMVVLRSPDHAPEEPKRVDGILCDLKADKLHFLHGAGWCGGKVLSYIIHYEDKTFATLDVVDGKNVMDWWSSPLGLPAAKVGWLGRNEVHMPVCVYLVEWHNPKPKMKISSIDLISSETGAIPFVVGVTAEVK